MFPWSEYYWSYYDHFLSSYEQRTTSTLSDQQQQQQQFFNQPRDISTPEHSSAEAGLKDLNPNVSESETNPDTLTHVWLVDIRTPYGLQLTLIKNGFLMNRLAGGKSVLKEEDDSSGALSTLILTF